MTQRRSLWARLHLRSCLLVLLLGVLGLVVLVAVAVFAIRQSWPEDGTRLAGGRVELIADGFIAAYLVELDDGGAALVDATMDRGAEAILHRLHAGGIEPEEVEAIFLTHGHGDHIAGARAFPQADVYALQPDVDLVEGRRVAQSPVGRRREARPTGIRVTRGLRDGERLRVGGTEVEVFAVPGHTLGSAAYLIHGVLFLGDAAAASGGVLTGPPPGFSADRQQGVRSLRQLAERLRPRSAEVRALAFGHQSPVDGLGPLLEWAEE